ncbi:MAG: mannitol dehydrogenase family protein [Pseudomonadota bacterium]
MEDTVKGASAIRLCDAHLNDLPSGIDRPRYDRSRLSPGIVHIGLGNFHRAHQAWYLHRLMQKGKALDWAIIGAGVRPYDAAMRDKLIAQDCLTTLIELNPHGSSAEIIGPMIDYLPIEEGNPSLISQMTDPQIRIVSLTVTEGGYYIDPVSGGFDSAHPDVQHDAAEPALPRTAFGAIVAALKARRENGAAPFTVLSCDNLQGNGDVARQTVVSLAKLLDPELAEWIDENTAFPNSMVDCIVPATGAQEIAAARALGIDDAAPVTHENFRQWVIEDRFCTGRPPWEDVGATITDDVHAYEALKIRVLNAGHQVLANVGEILGVPTISACMDHTAIAGFFRKVQTDEILPYVEPVPDMTPQAYLGLIEKRFANPAILDTTRRVAFDGSSRHTGFVLPILRDALTAGGPVEGLALVEAFWARMCAGEREDGTQIDPNDPHWAALQSCAAAARQDPLAWLQQNHVYGDLVDEKRFAEPFSNWLAKVWSKGANAAIDQYLADHND